MTSASYCVPGCPGTSQDILTRGMQSQLGHSGISQDIPVNCCISKQSHVQGILLCPRMSRDIPGHPNKRYIQYTLPARTSRDIPGHPSQLLYIQTIPRPGHPIVSQDVPGHPRTFGDIPRPGHPIVSQDVPGHPRTFGDIPRPGHPIVSQDVPEHPGTP